MESNHSRPQVGIGVIIKKKNKILLLKRSQSVSHGKGQWSFPGGHLEFGEKPEEAAQREVFEETGLRIKDLKLVSVSNNLYPKENKHYVTLAIQGKYVSGKPEIKESQNCTQIDWFTLQNLPSPLFPSIRTALECFRKRVVYLPS